MTTTILVVDDSRIMRNTVKMVFSGLGISSVFIEADNGEDALMQLNIYPIELVLLDWNMPKLSGLEFLKKVRCTDKFKSLPVVMVTSEAAKYNVIEALKAGATDYITKPINLELFKEKITKLPMYRAYRR